jgi:cell division protein FtsB
MEGDFYRRLPKQQHLRKLFNKLFKTRRRSIVTLLSALLVLYVLFDNKGIIARIRLELQKQDMEERVKAAERETKELETNIKALQGDKKTIEKVAREKHGMVREGETVYRVKSEK